MENELKLLNAQDVATILRVSVHSVRRWASQKKLHPVKLGARTLFDSADVVRFVDAARNADTENQQVVNRVEQDQ